MFYLQYTSILFIVIYFISHRMIISLLECTRTYQNLVLVRWQNMTHVANWICNFLSKAILVYSILSCIKTSVLLILLAYDSLEYSRSLRIMYIQSVYFLAIEKSSHSLILKYRYHLPHSITKLLTIQYMYYIYYTNNLLQQVISPAYQLGIDLNFRPSIR